MNRRDDRRERQMLSSCILVKKLFRVLIPKFYNTIVGLRMLYTLYISFTPTSILYEENYFSKIDKQIRTLLRRVIGLKSHVKIFWAVTK